ncbi:MAG: hypothetical protein IIX14_05310 [Clostridia bacterium]|nr:hypothetical protein [Clostridia bacterium]
MAKKLLSIALVAIMLFSCISLSASAEPIENPEYTIEKEFNVTVMDSYTLTEGLLSNFGVTFELIDKNVIALDGYDTTHTAEITKISAKRSTGPVVVYDAENPDEFLDLFRFEDESEAESIGINIAVKVDYASANVFGELGYKITINGFSTPPDLGIDLGDAVAVPTAIVTEGQFLEFPRLDANSLQVLNQSTKMTYLDSETPEVEGTKLQLDTVYDVYDETGKFVETKPFKSGTVTYSAANKHLFTASPELGQRIPVGTKEIVTFFFGHKLSTLGVSVKHDWSNGLVSITTDKYSDNKPGYHATVCNGCGETHDPQPHRVDPESWQSNNDATFTGNGTASTICLDCGATLTKDVLGSAQYNDAFSNYHFLLVIFDYINLILRFIGAAFPNA